MQDVRTTPFAFSLTDDGGVTIHGTMKLAPPMGANDPALGETWAQIVQGAPDSSACAKNPTRDAVVVGSLAFTNDTPQFAPEHPSIPLQADGDIHPVSFEIHYGEAATRCDVVYGGEASMDPAMDAEHWGPVPVAFVIPDVFGPNGFDADVYRSGQSGLSLGPDTHGGLSAGRNMQDLHHQGEYLSFSLPQPAG